MIKFSWAYAAVVMETDHSRTQLINKKPKRRVGALLFCSILPSVWPEWLLITNRSLA